MVYCDNDEARRHKSLLNWTYSYLTKRGMDLKFEVSTFITQSPLRMTFEDVQGHIARRPREFRIC